MPWCQGGTNLCEGKGKGKFRPVADHELPEGK